MTQEHLNKKDIPTAHKGLYAAYRADAMKQVARKMRLPFKILARTGEGYPPDHTVPEKMAYVSLDVKNKHEQFWKKVNDIAPLPTDPTEILSGAYLH